MKDHRIKFCLWFTKYKKWSNLGLAVLAIFLMYSCISPKPGSIESGVLGNDEFRLEFKDNDLCLIRKGGKEICFPVNKNVLSLHYRKGEFILEKTKMKSRGKQEGLGKYPFWTQGKSKDFSFVLSKEGRELRIKQPGSRLIKKFPMKKGERILFDGFQRGDVRVVGENLGASCPTDGPIGIGTAGFTLGFSDGEINSIKALIIGGRKLPSFFPNNSRAIVVEYTLDLTVGIGEMAIIDPTTGEGILMSELLDQYMTNSGSLDQDAQDVNERSQGELMELPNWEKMCCMSLDSVDIQTNCNGNLTLMDQLQPIFNFEGWTCPIGFVMEDSNCDGTDDCVGVYSPLNICTPEEGDVVTVNPCPNNCLVECGTTCP